MTLSNEALQFWFGGRGQMNWRCEEHLKGLLDAFLVEWPECKPVGPKARRSLEVSARDLYEELGERPKFMAWAKPKVSEGLTVKSPRSLMFLLPEWRKRVDGDPYRAGAGEDYWNE